VITFPDDLEPFPHLLSIIASHPKLSTAQWDTMGNLFFLALPSFPAGALSRIHIDNAWVLFQHSDKLSRTYSSPCDISVHSLTIHQLTPPKEFSLTFSNLYRVDVQLHLERDSATSQPLKWFSAFLERQPQLTWIEVALQPRERALTWHALKDLPFLASFCNAVDRQQLSSSFSFITVVAGHDVETDDQYVLSLAEIELESSVLDVIRCIGSSMPVSRTLALKFNVERDVSLSVVRVTIADIQ
jgi:hypothetical protein